jgi:hypothetical protein
MFLYCLFSEPRTAYCQLPGLLINNEFEGMWKEDVVALCFLLVNSPASEFYMPTFRNTLFHHHCLIQLMHLYTL